LILNGTVGLLRHRFQQSDQPLRVPIFRKPLQGLAAVLEAFVEGAEVQLFRMRRHGIGDGLAQSIGEETDNTTLTTTLRPDLRPGAWPALLYCQPL